MKRLKSESLSILKAVTHLGAGLGLVGLKQACGLVFDSVLVAVEDAFQATDEVARDVVFKRPEVANSSQSVLELLSSRMYVISLMHRITALQALVRYYEHLAEDIGAPFFSSSSEEWDQACEIMREHGRRIADEEYVVVITQLSDPRTVAKIEQAIAASDVATNDAVRAAARFFEEAKSASPVDWQSFRGDRKKVLQ